MTGEQTEKGIQEFLNNLVKQTIATELTTALIEPLLADVGGQIPALLDSLQEIQSFGQNSDDYSQQLVAQAETERDAAIASLTASILDVASLGSQLSGILTPVFDALTSSTEETTGSVAAAADSAKGSAKSAADSAAYAKAAVEAVGPEKIAEILDSKIPQFPGWEPSIVKFDAGIESVVSSFSTALDTLAEKIADKFGDAQVSLTVEVTPDIDVDVTGNARGCEPCERE